jgi:DNA-binding transcriptional LysR family regulator
MSHALGRLRDLFGDPILVRIGGAMQPTVRALAMRGPLDATLEAVRGLLAPSAFDPARSNRRFRLMMPDIVVDLLLTPLLAQVQAQAPSVSLETIPWQSPDDLGQDLARSIDFVIAVSSMRPLLRGFRSCLLYKDRDIIAVRRGHPRAAELSSLAAFRAARHVAVIPRGAHRDLIDDWLLERGVPRDIAVIVPGYLQALHVAARSDLVSFIPGRLVTEEAARLALHAVKPPLDPGVDEQHLFYPERAIHDPGSIWLRGVVTTLVVEYRRIRVQKRASILRGGRHDRGSKQAPLR